MHTYQVSVTVFTSVAASSAQILTPRIQAESASDAFNILNTRLAGQQAEGKIHSWTMPALAAFKIV